MALASQAVILLGCMADSTKRVELGATWEDLGLGAEDYARALEAVRPLGQRLGLAESLAPLEAQRWPASAPALPRLVLDDISAIPFLVNVVGVEEYQHRARVRAGDGDLYAAVTPETPGYGPYCSEVLGLGTSEFVQADVVGGRMEVAEACSQGPAFERICARTREAGGLSVDPYMGIQPVWDLAAKIASETSLPVHVLSPPPLATWVANDKALLSECVERTLDSSWIVETRESSEVDVLVQHLIDLATRHERVALKRTRCASGMGNLHFPAAKLREPERVRPRVEEFLRQTEWDQIEPVLVVAWEATPISPSSQIWIPAQGAGMPRLDGLYEQLLEGEERVFLGSRPSGLPAPVNHALARGSLLVCAALQSLGYVGRCSFDFLVLGDPEGEFQIRFTECNGRWGGTSTPMHLVDRLVKGPRPPYRAQDFQHADLVGVPFEEILARVGDELYRPSTGRGRFAFYNTGPLAKSGKLDVISFGPTQEAAEAGLLEDLPRLLGVN